MDKNVKSENMENTANISDKKSKKGKSKLGLFIIIMVIVITFISCIGSTSDENAISDNELSSSKVSETIDPSETVSEDKTEDIDLNDISEDTISQVYDTPAEKEIDEQDTWKEEAINSASNKVKSIKFSPTSVRNDVTGKWKISKIAETVTAEEYAPYYCALYYDGFGETDVCHWIINFTYNTTTCINSIGLENSVFITTYEYVDNEEHFADMLGTGELYSQILLDLSTGEVTKLQ